MKKFNPVYASAIYDFSVLTVMVIAGGALIIGAFKILDFISTRLNF